MQLVLDPITKKKSLDNRIINKEKAIEKKMLS